MINAILGRKIEQSQLFLEDGSRVPVTFIDSTNNVITQIKNREKNGYSAIQLGFGTRKKTKKPIAGHIRKAGLPAGKAGAQTIPRFFREVRIVDNTEESTETLKPGLEVKAAEVFKAGDIVQVTGVSKGKGFAGVVKRYNFKGGPRTHGQSDRERAPGSIGQTTTPGRVYRGKRMAGRMGHDKVTIKNLQVLDVIDERLIIKGLVPGGRNSLLVIKKMGESKKFVPLFKEIVEEEIKEVKDGSQEVES